MQLRELYWRKNRARALWGVRGLSFLSFCWNMGGSRGGIL